MADNEAHAALKVQAAWRGKAGLKKAVEKEQAARTGSERIVAAKRTIRNKQIAIMVLVIYFHPRNLPVLYKMY